jgi:hypothetical protein
MHDRIMDMSSRIYDAITASPENDPTVVVAAVNVILSTLIVELEIPEELATEQFHTSIRATRAMVEQFGWDWPHNSDEVH